MNPPPLTTNPNPNRRRRSHVKRPGQRPSVPPKKPTITVKTGSAAPAAGGGRRRRSKKGALKNLKK